MAAWLSEERPVNWVKRRIECTENSVLHALKYQLQLDIAEMNKSDQAKYGNSFELDNTGRSVGVTVKGQGTTEDRAVTLYLEDKGCIKVQIMNRNLFFITYSWNDDEAVCEFFIDDKPVKRWQISQRVLSPLFFGD